MTRISLETLVERVAGTTELRPRDVALALRHACEAIRLAVASGDEVALFNFGTFRAEEVDRRICRHPQTGEPMTVEAHRKVRFSPYLAFKDAVK